MRPCSNSFCVRHTNPNRSAHSFPKKACSGCPGVGLVNGLICSAVIFLTSILLGFGWMLSTTVTASLLCVIVFAALFGAFVPLMLDKRNIDPALATGPFITTANDIMGLIIYFSIGSLVATLMA